MNANPKTTNIHNLYSGPIPFIHQSISPDILQRALGAILGSAVGDALGAPFEFGPACQYSAQFPHPVLGGVGEMMGGGSFGWAPAEFTDDTQMTLALAESLLAQGSLDLDDLWTRFVSWRAGATDVGIATSRAISASDRFEAARNDAANPGRSASNGALMRTWAIALAYLGHSTEEVILAARTQASMTHFDPAAGWGAAIGTELCRRAILGGDVINQIDDVLSYVPNDQRIRFSHILSPDWTPGNQDEPSNGSVWTCLAEAVWAVRNHSNFSDVVTAAIDLGGDTDTVACVAGAIAGATYGIQGIPSRWTTYINGSINTPSGRKTYDFLGLQNIARSLIGSNPAVLTMRETPKEPQQVDETFAVFATDLGGALLSDPSFATVSLCLTGGELANHPIRREFYIRDNEGDANLDLLTLVSDAVDSIDALLAEGHRVLVHCHGGRSRTGLILKAWAMRQYDFDDQEADQWVTARWPYYATWNQTFLDFLKDDWNINRRR
jgi:ADP-ribosyl-[dinitrogen reductase] hydrolase